MSSSSSLLFSALPPMSPSGSSSASSSSRSPPEYRRSSNFSHASIYSRDSWCSTADSEISTSSTTQGHVSHDQEAFEQVVLASIANNAIFGSTSPRKNRSAGMRSSTESTRSWASSISSVRSPLTPDAALFSHREHDVTKTPTMASIALPGVAEVPVLKRPHLSRIVSDEVQYIGRSLDVPISEEGHQERTACIKRSASTASNSRSSVRNSRFSTWNGKDGLMLAMDELEQELARTMATLSTSASNSPSSSISKARGKAMRRPHTADKVMALGSASSFPTGLAYGAGSASAAPASRSRFQRESWMSSRSDEDSSTYNGKPIRFSASDLTLLAESAELSKRSSVQSISERPVSQVSSTSSSSSRACRADFDSPSVPALVFDGRFSGSSSSSSADGSFQEAPSRPDSFRKTVSRRPGTARESSAKPSSGSFYLLSKGSRSSPSLASAPPHEPLPPLPSLPAGLNQLLADAPSPPPRPVKSSARTPTSSHRNSPVPFSHKALPHLPC
ncbi:uncharacterized protein UTRI_00167_B [Ustilago trichophora]|uniref:Uncharacterized protein n=1 Tax=Ustilago trichophora TaxID=86804 RepID=A0A5C3DNU4_9BASI|nr:uncharacterized protein UTRI_00167_B [Ustilago trichophora]